MLLESSNAIQKMVSTEPKREKDIDNLKKSSSKPSKPSKSDRQKKSDNKKPHKTNNKKNNQDDADNGANLITNSKTPSKAKVECAWYDIFCKAQQMFATPGILSSLQTAPKIPVLA